MTPTTSIRSGVASVILGGVMVLSASAPAHAADWDLGHLPAFAFDADTLASSIITWPSDARSLEPTITTWSVDGSVEDLETTTHTSGETVVTLNADILFDFAKAVVPPTAASRIAASVAKAPKGSAVSIAGHTDDVGTPANNLKLSQARAQAVAVAIRRARPDLVLTVHGFGEGKPVATNSTDSGRSENRRVEIRFAG
jgi:outer membrane protein OmpA-like peptidoglycan-associated protein